MRHLGRNFRAISTGLAVLLMIAIAVIAALVVYAWVMGYIGASTAQSGQEIKIMSIANDLTDSDLLVYVQNVGEGTVQLEESSCLYVNGTLVGCTIFDVNVSDGVATLGEGETAALTYVGGAALPGEIVDIKVTAVSGIFAEKSGYPAGAGDTSPVDHFAFDTVETPQVSGVGFSVIITAMDHEGNAFWDYNGVNTLSCPCGEITPTTTGNFSSGIWTGEVTLTGASANATITTAIHSDSRKKGTSNTFVLFEAPPTVMWNKTYGGTDSEHASSMVETVDGGYAIAGYTYSDSSPPNTDFLLVKTDEFGNIEWNKTYGRSYDDEVRSLVATSDGGYAIAGETYTINESDITELIACWLIKTDTYGNVEWNKTYGGVYPGSGYSLVEASDGGYAIACTKIAYSDAGYSDVWLIKTDAYGNVEWNRTYGGIEGEIAYSLVKTSDGGYAIAGILDGDFWLIKTDEVGNMEWNQTYEVTTTAEVHSLVATYDGGYAIAAETSERVGGTTRSPEYEFEFWLIKTDGFGNMEWNITKEMTSNSYYSLVEAPDGGLAYSFDIGYDVFLVKMDSSGNMLWNRTYSGTYYNDDTSLISRSDGGYAIATSTSLPNIGSGFDLWLIRTH